MHFHYTSLRAILILFSHIQLAIPSSPFPSGFPSIRYIFSPPNVPHCPPILSFLGHYSLNFAVCICVTGRKKLNIPVMVQTFESQESVGQILERSKVHFRPPCDGECVGLWGKGGRDFPLLSFACSICRQLFAEGRSFKRQLLP